MENFQVSLRLYVDLLVFLSVEESAVFKAILAAKGCRMIARETAQAGHCGWV